ncbi:MAG: hypothetical protein ACM3RP_14050 [Chitinophagales bacterium]
MNKGTTGLTVVFSLLLAVTFGGIVLHQLTGYHYPTASEAAAFEMNVLGDLYEALVMVPVGLIGLWALRKGRAAGSLLIAGVAVHFGYNYAMAVMGRQNLWIFLWTAKLALAGTTFCLVWNLLPAGPSRPGKGRWAVIAYLAFVLVMFGGMMGQRLLASATGRTVEMTMEGNRTVDWGNPVLRDPIVFFALACPVLIAAILGLIRRTPWGGRAAALSSAFGASMSAVVLFTGPLKEYLQTGAVSPAMFRMSAIILLAAVPAVLSLIWLAKGERRPPATRATD